MTQGDATRSRSATTLVDKEARASDLPIIQSFKRGRMHLEPDATNEIEVPTITYNDDRPFESPSTETVIAGFEAATTTRVTPTESNHSRYLVSKLDRLHDKKERYQSHRDFLQKCLDNDIIPNGLRLELEPSIGNHDEAFLQNWYSKLEEYSKNFMKDVLAFCVKTNEETDANIATVNTELHTAVEKEQYDNVQATIIQNNSMRSQDLRRRKNRKFYALKFKKDTPRQNTSSRQSTWTEDQHQDKDTRRKEEQPRSETRPYENQSRYQTVRSDETNDKYEWRNERRPGRGYASAVRENTHQHETSQQEKPRRVWSRQNLSARGSRNNINNASTPLHQQISLQRKRSFRREDNNEEQLQSEIHKLQSQLKDIRGKNPATTKNSDVQIDNHSQNHEQSSKNVNTAQSSSMGVSKDDIRETYKFISSAMQTLKQFETRFATILNTDMILPDRS